MAWLDRAGSIALAGSIGAMVVLDLAALAAAATTRNRSLVNRWTGLVLAANLALIGVGLTGQAVAFTGRMAASMIRPLRPSPLVRVAGDDDAALHQRERTRRHGQQPRP